MQVCVWTGDCQVGGFADQCTVNKRRVSIWEGAVGPTSRTGLLRNVPSVGRPGELHRPAPRPCSGGPAAAAGSERAPPPCTASHMYRPAQVQVLCQMWLCCCNRSECTVLHVSRASGDAAPGAFQYATCGRAAVQHTCMLEAHRWLQEAACSLLVTS